MKYTRLTKEQFDELHPEFINFLATQSIDKAEWDKLKTEKPDVAEQELDIFSDLDLGRRFVESKIPRAFFQRTTFSFSNASILISIQLY